MPDPIPAWQPPLVEQFVSTDSSNLLIHYFGDVFDWHGYVKFLSLAALRETSRDVPLEKLFVEPHVAPQQLAPEAFDDPEKQPATEALSAALAAHPRLVLLGDPGSGKSTVVNWICTALGRGLEGPLARLLGGPLVPIPIVLRELRLAAGFAQIPDPAERLRLLLSLFLERPVAAQLNAERNLRPVEESLLCRLLESGQAIVLLDGIDEIGSIETREALKEAIHEGMCRYPRARWVMTSRIVGYEEVEFDLLQVAGKEGLKGGTATFKVTVEVADAADLSSVGAEMFGALGRRGKVAVRGIQLPVAERFYLAPFNDPQIEHFTRLWWAHHESNPHLAGTKPAQFLGALRQSHGARSLARLPHLLTMIALIYRVQAELPDGRALLYRFIADAYLGTLDKERGLDHLQPIPANVEEMARWLAAIGWELQRRRSEAAGDDGSPREVLIRRDELLALLSRVIRPRAGLSAEKTARLFLEYAGRRSGLLLPRGEELYAFLHLSFQEYFASLHFRDQISDPEWWSAEAAGPPGLRLADLRAYSGESVWRETLIFLWENAALINPKLPERLLVRLLGWPRDPARWGDFALPKKADLKDEKWQAWKPREQVLLVAALSVNPHTALEAPVQRALWQRCARWQVRLADTVYKAKAYGLWSWNEVTRQMLSRPGSAGDALRVLTEVVRAEKAAVLHLDGCPAVNDLRPLQGLSSLKRLYLGGCPAVGDLRPLQGLSSLQWLDLTGCTAVSDLRPLQSLSSLHGLVLHGCTTVSDLLPIEGLSSLLWLDLTGCTSASDLRPLQCLSSLRQLFLHGCTTVSDLLPIEGLSSLQWLDLTGCTTVSDLLPLQGLSSLQSLVLNRCTAVSDLLPLQGLSSLRHLDLNGCTAVSDAEVNWLQEALPNLMIYR